MSGSATYTPPQSQLAAFAIKTAVYVYDLQADDGESFTLLPNVQCLQVQYKEGNDPPTSQFQYILDDRAVAMGVPSQFEQLWQLDLPTPNLVGQYIATPTLRLVAIGTYPDGSTYTLFDGFPRMPTIAVHPESQSVSFSAIGVAIRCWDAPIDGRWQRDSVDPGEGDVVFVNLSCRFNPVAPGYPSGQPNCTPDDSDVNEGDDSVSYPVFLDPDIRRTPKPSGDDEGGTDYTEVGEHPVTIATFWTLSKAVRYILSKYNPPSPDEESDDDEGGGGDGTNDAGDDTAPLNPTYHQFVQNPDFSELTEVLDSRQPLEGQEYYDPNDPSTYTSNPIVIRDFDATNMAWPDALERLLSYHGFGMRWVLEQDDFAQPNNTFAVYRKDAGNAIEPKVFYYSTRGTPFSPSQQNVGTLQGSFDYHGVANQFVIETHPNRYEVSIVLAPGFTPKIGDETAANRKQFLKQNIDGAPLEIRQKYRYYIADECGDGHYNNAVGQTTGGTGTSASSTSATAGTSGTSATSQDGGGGGKGGTPIAGKWVTGTALDLSSLWHSNDPQDGTTPTPAYVNRYRKCGKTLLTTNTQIGTDDENDGGNRLPAQLAYSRDYTGKVATLWDGKGTWQPISSGSWDLLPDRIGIAFTSDSPEAIKSGTFTGGIANIVPQGTSKILRGIKCIANPNPKVKSESLFFLRLTTVIESDTSIEATANRRDASPLQNVVERRIDAKEHWRKDVVTPNSPYWVDAQTAAAANDFTGDNEDIDYDDDGNIVIRDDTQAAKDHAMQLRSAHEFPAIATAFTIPSFTLSYDIGDKISLIQGRNVSLQSNAGTEQDEAPQYPYIVGLIWDFDGKQSTTIQLSDKRTNPQNIFSHR